MKEMNAKCAARFQTVQDAISKKISQIDGKPFVEDLWDFEQKGGGRSRVLQGGYVFEKAGVNFSNVAGEFSENFAKDIPGEGRNFSATGISLVIHPHNPMVPTVHANFRYLTKGPKAWFGGGADLTPYYPYKEDCTHFHATWKTVCDAHPTVASYEKYKNWCDEYFYLKHRQEARGIGGIFFDYLETEPEKTFAFVSQAAESFLDAYLPIVLKRKDEPFTPQQREFQLYRRGRYVEFNLLYDRGTTFGLKTGGRVESILMSLPPQVQWPYQYKIAPNSREAELADFLKPTDWV